MKAQIKVLLIVLTISLNSVDYAVSATKTWSGNTSTDWNNSGNWVGGIVADSSDNIVVNSNAPNNLILTQNQKITNLTINGDTVDLGGYTFTITGTAYFNGGLVKNGLLKPIGSLCHFGGATLDARIEATCGYFHMNSGIYKKPVFLTSTGAATSSSTYGNHFEDSLTITNNGAVYFNMGSSGEDIYDGPVILYNYSSKEIRLAGTDTSYFNNSIYINDSLGGVEFGVSGGVSILASGKTISVGTFSSNYLTLNKFIQLGSTSQTLTLSGTAIISMVSCIFNGIVEINAPGFLAKNCIFNGAATLMKTGTANTHCYGGNIFAESTIIGNYNSSGRIRLASTTGDTFLNSVTFEGEEIQVAYTGVSDFYRHINNLGYTSSDVAFDAGNGTCRLLGNGFQELTGSTHKYKNLVVNQGYSSSRDVFYDTEITIKDTLNLISGKLIPFPLGTFIMKANSIVLGGSDSSFISGSVKKFGNTAFEYPIGKGNDFRPLTISAPTTATHAFTAEYVNDSQPFGENLDTTLAYLDDCSYWNLTRNVGNSVVFVTLSWENGSCPVKDTTYLKIASWYDDNWNDLGHGTITGNYAAGKMKTIGTNSAYEHFIFAYDSDIIKTIQPDEYITADGFVENIGQLLGTDSLPHPEILYYGSAFNSALFLADSVFSYVFSSTDSIYTPDSIAKHCVIDSLLRIDMKLKGINRSIEVSASDTSQGYKNYFLGYLDTSYTHALTFQEVIYNEIYDGIDLLFHNNDEFRFVLDSSSLSGSIEFYYQGADSVKIDGEGLLSIFTRLGNKKYGLNGFEYVNDEWVGIDVSYQKTDSIISFSLGTVTKNVPILISAGPWQFPFPPQVINPQNKLKWCTSYTTSGTFQDDYFNDVYIDQNDNILAIGVTQNPNFPHLNNIQPTLFGFQDISIIKFNPDRSRSFATWYGGSSIEAGFAITTDYNSNILFTGYTGSSDFPLCVSCTTPQSTLSGNLDAYLVKLTLNGQIPLMSTYFGGSQNDVGYGTAVDKLNNIYLVGGTSGGIPTPSTQPANSFFSDFTANSNAGNNNLHDGFICKFSTSNMLEWSTHYGSDGLTTGTAKDELISSIAFDESGNNFYVMGFTNCDKVETCAAPCLTNVSTDFPITGSNYIYDTPDGYDYFIVKFNSSLQVIWSTLWGGSGDDYFGAQGGGAYQSKALTVNPLNDDIIITGLTNSNDIDTEDIGGSSYFDGVPAPSFIASFDSNDNLKWCTYYMGETRSIAANDAGQFIVSGTTINDNLYLVQSNLGAYYQPLINNLSVNNGKGDGFLLKFNSSFVLNHGTYIGGEADDIILSCAIQKTNGTNIVCVGLARSPDFPWKDYIPNYTGDYSTGDPGMIIANYDGTPFVLNLYNVTTPLRSVTPNQPQIKNESVNSLVKIYPNPTGDQISIQSSQDILEATIFGISGYKLKNFIIPGSKNYKLDIMDLPDGIYILELYSSKIINRQKIIKITK